MAKKLHTLAILCAALAMTAGAQQPAQGARTWAVVIGISKYQKLPGGQQLQFADRDAILANLAPGPKIAASPGFADDPHAGMFDRHDILLVRTAQIGSLDAGRGRSRTTHRSSPEAVNGAKFAE